MIIQAYTSTPELPDHPIVWDNAVQVSYFRQSVQDYTQEGEHTNFHGLVHGQLRHGQYDASDMVRVANWVDRVTGESHQLGSLDDVFVLNDEGKTFARV